MNKNLITGVLTATMISGAAFFGVVGATFAQDATKVELDLTEPLPDILYGNPEATVTVIEYANYTCSHCGNFYKNVYNQLKTEYIDTGKVNLIQREIITDGVGLTAVLATRCLPDDKYYGMAELLYKNQDVWAYGKESMEDVRAEIAKYAALAGLGGEALEQCYTGMAEDATEEERAKLEAMLKLAGDRATKDKVKGTPTIMVNGKMLDDWSWDNIKSEIDAALNE